MGSSLLVSYAALFLLLISKTNSSPPNILTDREALLSFKAQTSDPSNALSTWNESSSICEWKGVFCHKQKQRVSGINLQGIGLRGSISPHIGNLSFLKFLYLQDNQFTGILPDQIGYLSRLRFLNMSSNLIEGVIPLNISRCSELIVLDLAGNKISGGIPPGIGSVSKLQVLKLSQNRLMGTIPASIANLSLLTTLNLATNNLTGVIPASLGYLPSLQHLQISINNFQGTVPQSLYNVSSLATLAFASNQLSGEIPTDVGFTLPNLRNFHTCFNNITGQIPSSLSNITMINSIRMSNCFMTGPVPVEGLSKLSNLVMYNIGFNRVVGSSNDLINALTNSTNLQYIAFDDTLVEGSIPDSVGNLSNRLVKLYIGGNGIRGSIPPTIGRLSNLALLNLSYNSISGVIPSEIGQLKELQMLGLAGNNIDGEIPGALGNLSKLTKLEFSGNNLVGRIPATFGNYQRLILLDLSNNRLNGSIPKEVFSLTSLNSLVNLSKNSFTGSLPQEIGMLENVISLDISHNQFLGGIPNSIGTCKSLQYLSMSDNLLSGSIPNALGEVKGLQSLDLSTNQLSGSIPDNLGDLQALQFLNFSFNDLQGDIPKTGAFRNLSIVHLEGNPKLCVSSDCKKNSHDPSLQIALLVAAYISAFLIVALLAFLFYRWKYANAKVLAASGTLEGKFRIVSYEEIQKATGNFDPENLIGTGGFGSVYRGILRDGFTTAIKVLNHGIDGASKSFIAECEVLRNVRHRNLVKLITSCSSVDFGNNDFHALVYEFVNNGSLEDWLRGRKRHEDGSGLNILERMNIAIDIASAMDYLHHDCEMAVVHRDLKPSNVLLDEEMTAKVGDFGLAKLLAKRDGDQKSITSTNGIQGSIGYIPPEYGLGRKASTRGDVYSYGVMLLELVTGKSPTDETFQGDLTLEKWVRTAYPVRSMVILDPELIRPIKGISHEGRPFSPQKQQECLESVIQVGLSCAVDLPKARLSMRDVLYQLQGIRIGLLKVENLTWVSKIE